MADVYEVEHLELGASFAAKVMREASREERSVRRFLREARLLAGLRSDHIVTVFDVSSPRDEHTFYVMELLHGSDLRKLMKDTPVFSLERAAKLVSDACAGLGAAHAAGLVHRDMKPENLFVTHRDSGQELCKVLDFGVVKVNAGTSTRDGALIGTLRYMAPEQIEHPTSVGVRADVYALGAILYECLTRRPVHASESVERLLFEILNQPITPMRSHRSDLPEEFERVVRRALEKDPLQRFASVEAMADALRPFARNSGAMELTLLTPVEDRPASVVARQRSKHTRRAAVSGLFVGILVTGALVSGGDSGAKELALPFPRSAMVPSTGETVPPDLKTETESGVAPKVAATAVRTATSPSARPRGSRVVRSQKLRVPPVPGSAAIGEAVPPIGRVDTKNPYDG
jgi:serine/threonine protein kinase